MSLLYHGLQGHTKDVLRELDHQSTFLLIAGTDTPCCLSTLRGPWGWTLFGVVRGLGLSASLIEFHPLRGLRVLPL
jgi:hemolysin III